MAIAHANLLRQLPLAFHQRVIIWTVQQNSRVHGKSTMPLLQRTWTSTTCTCRRAFRTRVGAYSGQQQKHGVLKVNAPTSSVNLPHKCSWMSPSAGTLSDLLRWRSDNICGNPRRSNEIVEKAVRSFGSTNGVGVPWTNRTFSGSSSGLQAGPRQFQLLKPSLNLAGGTRSRGVSLFGFPERSAWALAIAEAEKLVGYPTSFISLRCLLSDELSNVAMQVRKLVGTKHPLVKTARNFVYDGKHNVQTRGLIVLLISKAAGPSPKNMNRQSMVRGIYPSQRTLAEIAEMIHTAFLVHKGVVDIQDLLPSDGPRSIMEFGNKISVLSGDFLLASACTSVAQLRNTYVVDLVSQSIADLTEAAFTAFSEEDGGGPGGRGRHQQPLPNLGVADWAEYVYLSSGSLIAKSCRAALALAGHGEEMQSRAFEFGKNITLAQQLHQELQPFTASDGSPPSFSLTSAPVLLHLEGRGSQERVRDQTKVDIKKLHQEIRSGSAIKRSQELCRTYGESAHLAISGFPQSDAKDALQNLVKAVSL